MSTKTKKKKKRNLKQVSRSINDDEENKRKPKKRKVSKDEAKIAIQKLVDTFAPNAVVCWADGCSLGNPGSSGSGCSVSFVAGGDECKRTKVNLAANRTLGHSTNNIAELDAIAMALEVLSEYEASSASCTLRGRPIEIISDSMYAANMLVNGYNASKNVEQIEAIKKAIDERKRTNTLRIHWVQGHSGVPENEFVDQIANLAAKASSALSKKTDCGETLPTRKHYIVQP